MERFFIEHTDEEREFLGTFWKGAGGWTDKLDRAKLYNKADLKRALRYHGSFRRNRFGGVPFDKIRVCPVEIVIDPAQLLSDIWTDDGIDV